ncbi:MAG TPA: SRPBCC family protein [Burkholderiaceae bacterium]
MSRDNSSKFVYVSYIRTTPEKLWQAITTPEFMDQYWLGAQFRAEWKVGGAWSITYPDGRITDTGEVIEFDPPRRIALTWRNEFRPELNAEGFGRCVFDVEQAGSAARLRVTHSIEVPESKLIEAVSGGWPLILSNLKSLIEGGEICVTRKDAL